MLDEPPRYQESVLAPTQAPEKLRHAPGFWFLGKAGCRLLPATRCEASPLLCYRMGPSGLLLALGLHLAVCSRPHRDYCVLGAGPAGLQMAALLQRAGRDYEVFERESAPGSFFTRYPRHRKLISINKRYTGKANAEFNLRHDWNSLLSDDPHLLFRHYSQAYFPDASDMVHYLGDFAKRLGLHVLYNTNITHVTLDKDPQAWNGHYFILTDQNGQAYQCR